jgi:hypothetical protein
LFYRRFLGSVLVSATFQKQYLKARNALRRRSQAGAYRFLLKTGARGAFFFNAREYSSYTLSSSILPSLRSQILRYTLEVGPFLIGQGWTKARGQTHPIALKFIF